MRVFLFGFLFFASINSLADCQFDDLYCHILSSIDFQTQFTGVFLVLFGLICSAVVLYALFIILNFIVVSPQDLRKKFYCHKFDSKSSLDDHQTEDQDFEQKEENKEAKLT